MRISTNAHILDQDIYKNIPALLRPFSPVLRSAFLSVFNWRAVETATNDVIANTRKVLYTAATNEHDAVFLEVMAFTADVGDHFLPGRETNPCYFT
jgi:hypothetical protein